MEFGGCLEKFFEDFQCTHHSQQDLHHHWNRMWWEQGLDNQKHQDGIGTSCFVDEFGGDEVLNMDEHGNSL